MIGAVVDTNVLVRATICPRGSVGPVIQALRDGIYRLTYSDPLLDELVDDLNRPRIRDKYALRPDDIAALIEVIMRRGQVARLTHG